MVGKGKKGKKKKKGGKKERRGRRQQCVDHRLSLSRIVTQQLYASDQVNSLRKRVQNTEVKWNSRMPVFYIWLLCHVFFCFVLCVWILSIYDETGLWRWRVRSWNVLWETGALLCYWKLPGHIPGPDLETCLKESSWHFLNYFPQW